MNISFRCTDPRAIHPAYQTPGAVAFDLAVLEGGTLAPNERRLFGTGIVIKVPTGQALILAPRSSNAKKGILLANTIGVIDQDYCGPEDEIKLFLHNIGSAPYTLEPGERIAQGLFVPITKGIFVEEAVWGSATNRGGFGTTG